MKKPQLLQLIQRGGRHQPAIYRFGANETLKIYAGGRVDIGDAVTGEVVRRINTSWLRDWGYSPAKLFPGDTDDQFLECTNQTPWREHIINVVRTVAFAGALGVALAMVSSITGCTSYILQQLDKDIATSTEHPTNNYQAQANFKQANKHANEFLVRSRAKED